MTVVKQIMTQCNMSCFIVRFVEIYQRLGPAKDKIIFNIF